MKKGFKRLGIVLIILLSILGTESILQKGYCSNAAILGDTLLQAEDGWQRYDDDNENIVYDNNWQYWSNEGNVYGGKYHHNYSNAKDIIVGAKVKFSFFGTKVRIITAMWGGDSGANVKIDGVDYGNYSNHLYDNGGSRLFFEKQDLKQSLHKVEITTLDKSEFSPQAKDNWFAIDAIDIDKDGELVPYNENTNVSSIVLNKDTDTLGVGENDTLIAKVLPENADNKNVTWESSDDSIVTVDENGKVTGVKEGKATIIASTTDGTKLTASCEVTVTKENENMSILSIKMVTDDKIRTYNLTEEELNEFLDWYDARSKGTALAYYILKNEIDGGKDYIPYDKIEYFNIK